MLSFSAAMPCRKESFLLLEQSVTVGSKEVDTLVARIGEALQLNAQRAPSSSCGMGYGTLRPPARPPGHCSCVRGRATPYPVCTPRGAGRGSKHQDSGAASKQLCGRGWIRGGCRRHGQQDEEDEGPHQLLQELLLNGNLIKEAVRRLHMAAERPPEPAVPWEPGPQGLPGDSTQEIAPRGQARACGERKAEYRPGL